MTNHLSPQRVLRPDLRGLLASTGFEGQPVKGTYFFAGERRNDNAGQYTTHPLDARDEQWNSDVSTRGWVMDRMVSAHVNTVVMSYWSNMPTFSPMDIQSTTLSGVLDAVQGRPLVVMPAIESGYTPGLPSWEFSNDFPSPGGFEFAPGLVRRIGWLVELFSGRMSSWATIYDRDGYPRHAVHLLHVCSDLIDQDAPVVMICSHTRLTLWRQKWKYNSTSPLDSPSMQSAANATRPILARPAPRWSERPLYLPYKVMRPRCSAAW